MNLKNVSAIQGEIKSISENAGILRAEQCHKICLKLDVSVESLMIELLPLAAAYALAPVSSFHVGAIVRGEEDDNGLAALYFGANVEFKDQALGHTLHAEQSAISNAWLAGESKVTALAISAPPCGHCRQFLYEVSAGSPFPILLPKDTFEGLTGLLANEDCEYDSLELNQLLPAAFGPKDLGSDRVLMEPNPKAPELHINSESAAESMANSDRVVALALKEAQLSYAPYSENFAAVILELSTGKLVVGRYAENVAFNPSLHPFVAAISQFVLSEPLNNQVEIRRAVLLERPTSSNQKNSTQILLSSYAAKVKLEYFSASIN